MRELYFEVLSPVPIYSFAMQIYSMVITFSSHDNEAVSTLLNRLHNADIMI